MKNWNPKQARSILRNFGQLYKLQRGERKYINENIEVADSAEEFVLFLLQGIGLARHQIEQEILVEEMGYDLSEAQQVTQDILGEEKNHV